MSEKKIYTFVPWLRKGISGNINESDTLGESDGSVARPTFDVNISIEAKSIDEKKNKLDAPIRKTIGILGPGDVVGIKQNAIIKTVPKNNTTNLAPNYLAHIEFYDEDFPWRYSPADAPDIARDKLRPWLALVVLKEDEFVERIEQVKRGPLPAITIQNPKTVFPSSEETWAWAHVHYTGKIEPPNTLEKAIAKNPNAACSRILCPRQLEPKTSYHAFLVPAFEQGRLSGLGKEATEIEAIPQQRVSWSSDGPIDFPIYHSWYFATGVKGDFEYLVRLLEPRENLNPKIGRRDMDIQHAGDVYGLHLKPEDPDVFQNGTIPLEGALQLANSEQTPDINEYKSVKSFNDGLREILSINVKDKNVDSDGYDDEVILPPLYGEFQRGSNKIPEKTNHWFRTLNLDPRFRAVAGLGVAVVQKHQETYMERCWKQMEEVISENEQRRKDFFTYTTHEVYFEKNFEMAISNGNLTSIMPMAPRIYIKDKASTIKDLTIASKTPTAFAQAAFLKFMRPGSPAVRRLSPSPVIEAITSNRFQSSLKFQDNGFPGTFNLGLEQMTLSFKSSGVDVFEYPIDKNKNSLLDNDFKPPLLKRSTANSRIPLVSAIKERLHPKNTLKNKFLLRKRHFNLKASVNSNSTSTTEEEVPQKIMAYPKLDDAMCDMIIAKGSDFLLPNINLIPPNTVALLKTNRDFIDAYMIGLNHEMSRELFWREYPTDQRGSYFRKFWTNLDKTNETNQYDIKEIQKWGDEILGDSSHNPKAFSDGNDDERLILAIRGELLNRFPNAMIFLAKSIGSEDDRKPSKSDKILPLFHAKVLPDITFLGFNLTIKQAEEYFVVIGEEPPGEPRFGLDIGSDYTDRINKWDDLSWKHMGHQDAQAVADGIISIANTKEKFIANNIYKGDIKNWGKNAAYMAKIFQQKPFMVAIHSSDLIPEKK